MVEARGLVKRYGSHVALDGVSLSIARGSVHGLLGPNGAGKSTFLRILTGITSADGGSLLVDGAPLCRRHARLMGYLPEERGLYRRMGAYECALFLARLHGLDGRQARRRLDEWFERLGLTAWRGRRVEELSKGMQQRVQFISTVAHEPPLLIFDEPLSGLDPLSGEMLRGEMRRLRERGATIVMSTHDMGSVESLCDAATFIAASRVVSSGPVAELRRGRSTGQWEARFASRPAELRLPEGTELTRWDGTTATLHSTIPGEELLRHLVEQGPVVAFEERLPTMSDIFIELARPRGAAPAAERQDTCANCG